MNDAILATLGVAIAAIAVWVAVRLINRRKKLGRQFWVSAVLLGLLVLYVASFGPACWIASRTDAGPTIVDRIYQPLMRVWWRGAVPSDRDLMQRYVRLYAYSDSSKSNKVKKLWFVGLDRRSNQYNFAGGYF